MKIQLTEKYRLVTDEYQFILQEKRTMDKRGYEYKCLSYYQSIDLVMKDLLAMDIFKSSAKGSIIDGLKEIKDTIKKSEENIVEAIKKCKPLNDMIDEQI